MAFKNFAKNKKRIIEKLMRAVAAAVVFLLILSVIQVLFVKFFAPPFTAQILFRRTAQHWTGKPYKPPSFYWRDLKTISPNLRKAVLAAEDQRFNSHHGFDFIELRVAVEDFFDSGRLRGASTITMQTARTLFLWNGRNFARKGLEAYYTVLMELLIGKKRIYELYLNTVDWGRDIMGAEAAARKYFNTSSGRLGSKQAALLAAILPRPHRWSPGAPSTYLLQRRDRILKDMKLMPLL